MLEVIVAIFILASLIIYALMGGADFGGGIWNLLAFGPRAQRQREAIANAIAPIWEANHVWLSLVIVLLFTGCPRGFATTMRALSTSLTLDTRDEPDLQDDFRRRSLWSGLALAPIALAVFLTSRRGAPAMYYELTRWWAPVLLVWTSLFAGAALVAVWLRRFVLARLAAIGQVTLILVGWGLAQYPNLVTPDVTVANAAAPEFTLRLVVIALGFGAVLLLPSLAYLFYVFKRRE